VTMMQDTLDSAIPNGPLAIQFVHVSKMAKGRQP